MEEFGRIVCISRFSSRWDQLVSHFDCNWLDNGAPHFHSFQGWNILLRLIGFLIWRWGVIRLIEAHDPFDGDIKEGLGVFQRVYEHLLGTQGSDWGSVHTFISSRVSSEAAPAAVSELHSGLKDLRHVFYLVLVHPGSVEGTGDDLHVGHVRTEWGRCFVLFGGAGHAKSACFSEEIGSLGGFRRGR